MSCADFERQIVSDDPREREAAVAHGRTCERCNEILVGQRQLSIAARDWRASVARPARLEKRVLDALRCQESQARELPFRGSASGRMVPWVWAAAATLVLGIGLAWMLLQMTPRAPQTASRLLVEEALAVAESAERDQAKAIARLEVAAAPVLATADNFDLQAHQAARLMDYRDRLAFLDATIEEIQDFVDSNPGQARARTLLLAAYKEKTQVLRDVLALEERS